MEPTPVRAVAYVEGTWMRRLRGATVHCYSLPPASFEDTGDTGMWVSRIAGCLVLAEPLDTLDARQSAADVGVTLQNGVKCRSAASWVCVIDRAKRSSLIGRVVSDTALDKSRV